MASDEGGDIAESDFRPLSPKGEQRAIDDPQFVKNCLQNLELLNSTGNIQVDSQMLTNNQKFGVVFRADFIIDGVRHPRYINRLICWRQNGENIEATYAIGQDIPPLI